MINDSEAGSPRYGDASFRAAGGEAGLRPLVDRFYDLIEERPEAARIREMHPQDLEVARDKLTRFLCGWLGGPKRYAEKFGPIEIPTNRMEFSTQISCVANRMGIQDNAEQSIINGWFHEQNGNRHELIRLC